MTSLLQHPHLILGEGPQGFRLRLADANGLNLATLKSLGIFFDVSLLKSLRCLPDVSTPDPLMGYATLVARHWDAYPQLRNMSRCRCCPSCLAHHEYWRIGWEQIFYDVCPVHGCWLVDQCDRCGTAITWRRQELLRCDCGHRFSSSKVSAAPPASMTLAIALQSQLPGAGGECQLLPMLGLNFEQATRLVRLLGTYGQLQVGRLPQKIQNVGAMDVSWQITSTAAEIMNHWPQSFELMLHSLLDRTTESTGQRFPARFGSFYSLLYKRFADEAFVNLRSAFEGFVAEHWRGPIAKRNTRLSQALLKNAAWVPANHARRHLQVSASRLIQLVRSGALVGEERVSEKGRRFLVVQRESMMAMLPALDDEIDLVTASEMLGLTKTRMRSTLPRLFPNARKTEGDANRWAISRTGILGFLETCNVPAVSKIEIGQISLEHVLRFWCCSEDEIASLFKAVQDGSLRPLGRLGQGGGLPRLVFEEEQVRQNIDHGRSSAHEKWTIPRVAEMLNIKQEVAYFLVRQGLLATDTETVGRRQTAMVTRDGLNAFRDRYFFARDLAKLHMTSSRSLQFRLAEVGIHPVATPTGGAGRQLIYEQTPALEELLPHFLRGR